MKVVKPWLIFLVTLITLSYAETASGAKITREKIVSGGKTRTYYQFVPEKLSASKPLPVIVLLHGSGGIGLYMVEEWQGLAAREDIILVGPDSSDSFSWATPKDGPDFLRDVVEVLKEKYPVNPRRVYLFGHSAGASYALYMSLFESQYFAATAIHAGILPPKGDSVMELARRKIPFGIWVGTRDPLLPLSVARATRDQLNARGFHVQFTEILGHNHWYYARASQINEEVWEFLKRHELAEDPQYVRYQFGKKDG